MPMGGSNEPRVARKKPHREAGRFPGGNGEVNAVNIMSSTIDGSIAVLGLLAGLLALVGSLKASEPAAEVQEPAEGCKDCMPSKKAA